MGEQEEKGLDGAPENGRILMMERSDKRLYCISTEWDDIAKWDDKLVAGHICYDINGTMQRTVGARCSCPCPYVSVSSFKWNKGENISRMCLCLSKRVLLGDRVHSKPPNCTEHSIEAGGVESQTKGCRERESQKSMTIKRKWRKRKAFFPTKNGKLFKNEKSVCTRKIEIN